MLLIGLLLRLVALIVAACPPMPMGLLMDTRSETAAPDLPAQLTFHHYKELLVPSLNFLHILYRMRRHNTGVRTSAGVSLGASMHIDYLLDVR